MQFCPYWLNCFGFILLNKSVNGTNWWLGTALLLYDKKGAGFLFNYIWSCECMTSYGQKEKKKLEFLLVKRVKLCIKHPMVLMHFLIYCSDERGKERHLCAITLQKTEG